MMLFRTEFRNKLALANITPGIDCFYAETHKPAQHISFRNVYCNSI